MTDGRAEFLRTMYGTMWDNINRHITVIWSSVTVLFGAFAALGLVEKDVLPVDLAIVLVVTVAMWHLGHIYDASYWVNRNLLIIQNIERQFLSTQDIRDIHFYFGRPPRRNTMIDHFRVQFSLGIAVPVVMLLYHYSKRGMPMNCTLTELFKIVPYVILVVGISLVLALRRKHHSSYEKLREASPGRNLEVTSHHS
jgi:hypothetical protein